MASASCPFLWIMPKTKSLKSFKAQSHAKVSSDIGVEGRRISRAYAAPRPILKGD